MTEQEALFSRLYFESKTMKNSTKLLFTFDRADSSADFFASASKQKQFENCSKLKIFTSTELNVKVSS